LILFIFSNHKENQPMRDLVISLFLIIWQSMQTGYAQTPVIDSLRTVFINSGIEKQKLLAAVLMLDEYESLHTDSIAIYYELSEKLLRNNYSKEDALNIAVTKIRLLRRKTKFEEALLLCDSSLAACANIGNSQVIYRKLIAAKSAILTSQFKYKEALDICFDALKKAEREKDDISQIYCKITIGWVNMEMTKNRDALLWFFDAIKHSDKIGYTTKQGTTYANITAVYAEMKKIDSAEFYIRKAFEVALKHNNLTVQANCYYIFSDIMVEKGNIAEAEKAMKAGTKIRRKIGDPYFYVSDLYQLSIFYANNKQPQKGIAVSLEGIEFAIKNKLSGKYLILYDALAKNYKVAGDDKLYSSTLEKIIALKDSLYKNNSAQSLAEMQTKYEVQKKETLITKQKLDLLQRNLLLYGAGVLAIVLAIFLGYRFKKYQQKQKAIAEQKRKQNEVAIRDAEEKERKRIAAELHDNLGVQANAILHNSTLLSEGNTNSKTVVADLQETAKEMLLNLRETLWAMKTADVSATDLWLRIINFTKQMGRHYTAINFTVKGTPPADFVISSSQALHIVLVLQETVNNSVKHAAAKMITVTSISKATGWEIMITDDGKGFVLDDATTKTDSYGLSNMQQRAREGNFVYEIQSLINKGTATILRINS
jgi:two-component system, NarL family, sensor kinase